jgi:hypothetical protein
MANDADWVADVRRWYFNNGPKPSMPAPGPDSESAALGYEAAQPSIEAREWPETSTTDFVNLK